jgi:hypothetical protein
VAEDALDEIIFVEVFGKVKGNGGAKVLFFLTVGLLRINT